MKAWMNGEVRALFRAKKAQSGDKEVYNTTRATLKAGIKEAKQRHQQKLDSTPTTPKIHPSQATKTGAPIMCEATLPYEMNTFYARFDLLNKESAVKSTLPPEDWPLSVSTVDVRRILLRVNMSKAVGPDNIHGCVVRTCASQLVVF